MFNNVVTREGRACRTTNHCRAYFDMCRPHVVFFFFSFDFHQSPDQNECKWRSGLLTALQKLVLQKKVCLCVHMYASLIFTETLLNTAPPPNSQSYIIKLAKCYFFFFCLAAQNGESGEVPKCPVHSSMCVDERYLETF